MLEKYWCYMDGGITNANAGATFVVDNNYFCL